MAIDNSDLRDVLERTYWNARSVLEISKHCLESPHPLWGYLNELIENVGEIELVLNIRNPMDGPNGV